MTYTLVKRLFSGVYQNIVTDGAGAGRFNSESSRERAAVVALGKVGGEAVGASPLLMHRVG